MLVVKATILSFVQTYLIYISLFKKRPKLPQTSVILLGLGWNMLVIPVVKTKVSHISD